MLFQDNQVREEDFKKWVEFAENSPTLSLNEALKIYIVIITEKRATKY